MIGPIYTAYVESAGDVTFLVIEDQDQGMSVTNGIDVVLAEQVNAGNLQPHYRVIYRDTEHTWDEVIIGTRCEYRSFFSLNASNLFDAMRVSLAKRPPSTIESLLNLPGEPSFKGEPNDDDLLRLGYERPFRVLPDGRIAAVMPINQFTDALVIGLHPWGHDDAFYYSHGEAAKMLAAWDGEAEPQGWTRHPQSDRLRPEGDPEREYIQP
jgi:hypothetical protein